MAPPSAGLRSAATRRRPPRTRCLPLDHLASGPHSDPDCDLVLFRKLEEFSQRARARTRQGLRSRSRGRRRRPSGSL